MRFVLNGKEDIYKQIVSNYKRLIEEKVLEAGTYLPSVRDLAKDLGINPNTVSKAYSLLESDGYVTILNKKGAYVSYNGGIDELSSFKEEVRKLKEKGIKEEELLKEIKKIYGGESK